MTHPVGLAEWPTLYPVGASEDEREVRAVMARLKRAEAHVKAVRAEAAEVIAAKAAAGRRQVDLVRWSGYTREHIRRIVRDATEASDDDNAADSA